MLFASLSTPSTDFFSVVLISLCLSCFAFSVPNISFSSFVSSTLPFCFDYAPIESFASMVSSRVGFVFWFSPMVVLDRFEVPIVILTKTSMFVVLASVSYATGSTGCVAVNRFANILARNYMLYSQ